MTVTAIPFVPVSATVQPTVVLASLLPQERIPRLALAHWAANLTRAVEFCERSIRTLHKRCAAIASIANNAALIASYAGDAATGRALCEKQMGFHQRTARRARDPGITGFAMQPWINRVRLDALAGNWQGAVASYGRLRSYRPGEALRLNDLIIPAEGWRGPCVTEQEFAWLLEMVYVLDSLRTLLLARQWSEANELATRLRVEADPRLASFADEATVVSATMLSDLARARRVACAALRASTGWTRIAFQLRLVETTLQIGDVASARAALAPVARVLGQLTPGALRCSQRLQAVVRAATLCGEVGVPALAVPLGRRVLVGAQVIGDETLEIDALRILVRVGPWDERDAWSAALEQRQAQTLYRSHRARGDSPVTPSSALRELFERLNAALAR